MKIIISKDNTVLAISEEIQEVDNGFYIPSHDVIYSSGVYTMYDVGVISSEIKEFAYLYNPTDGFIKNPSYKEFIPVDVQIENLQLKNSELELQNAQMLLALVNGGLM